MNFISRAIICGFIGLAAPSAMAGELSDSRNSMKSESMPLSLMSVSGANDWARYEIAPNWSRELGWSLKGKFGTYISDDLAIGAIVEYGQDKREYLTNAGIRLSDELSFIGSVGMLEEHREYVADAGRETARQMEYGVSLKSAHQVGLFSGFELNGYLADANAQSDNIETGKLYGTQILANINLADTTRIKIGGGYEWLRWDDGEENNDFSFHADGVQQLTNDLSANANVKLGASEYVYGGGLAFNLGDHNHTNVIGLNYEYIQGQDGIQDDQRIELSWRIGLGVSPNSQISEQYSKGSNASGSNADVPSNASANSLLADVMKRPEFFPKRVLAKAGDTCPLTVVYYLNGEQGGATAGPYYQDMNINQTIIHLAAATQEGIDTIGTNWTFTVDGTPANGGTRTGWGSFNGLVPYWISTDTRLTGSHALQLSNGVVTCNIQLTQYVVS